MVGRTVSGIYESNRVAGEFEAGLAKREITAFHQGRLLLGWYDLRNEARRLSDALYCRALVVKQSSEASIVAIACAELCFIGPALREAVLARLTHANSRINGDNLLLCATHNHSGPGGISGYAWFDVPCGGLAEDVVATIADGIAGALLQAEREMSPARLRCASGAMSTDEPLAYNRSVGAYNRNRGTAHVTEAKAWKAVDQEMTVLRVESPSGQARGLIAWYGVHGTCIHGDQTQLTFDHKGEAARRAEDAGGPDFVALFPQAPSGDVTSNYRPDKQRKVNVGPGADDVASRRIVGRRQAELALQLLEQAVKAPELKGSVASVCEEIDFERPQLSARYAPASHACTVPPTVGIGTLEGTAEGKGPLWALGPALRILSRSLNWLTQSPASELLAPETLASLPKLPLLNVHLRSQGKWFGLLSHRHLRRLQVLHPFLESLADGIEDGSVDRAPWAPARVPAQLIAIGPLLIAAVAGEPTTVAGRQMRRAILSGLDRGGEFRVVVTPYANDYSGYITTEDEYGEQRYEAASTLYGRYTNAAWCSALERLSRRLQLQRDERKSRERDSSIDARSLAASRLHYNPPLGAGMSQSG